MTAAQQIRMIAPRDIDADPKWNSRQSEVIEVEGEDWSDERLESSIREKGLLQSLRVQRIPGTKRWWLVAGFRRHRFCMKIDPNKEVPCTIRESTGDERIDDQKARLENVIENVQRSNLKPWELAEAIHKFRHQDGLEPGTIARELGISDGYVKNLLRLKERLCEELWEGFKTQPARFKQRHLLDICTLPKPDQVQAYNDASQDRRGGRPKKGAKAQGRGYNKWLADVEEQLDSEESSSKRDFLKGAAAALEAVLSGDWNLSKMLRRQR